MEKFLESVPKARVLRLLLQNPQRLFPLPEIAKKTRVSHAAAKRELRRFLEMGVAIEKRGVNAGVSLPASEIEEPPKSAKRARAKSVISYGIHPSFGALEELRRFIAKTSGVSEKTVLQKIKALGKMKLVLIAGALIHQESSRTDLLVVGNQIPKNRLNEFLNEMELDIGKPLHYTVMSEEEFSYRRNMYDRFLRDVLESPHRILVNKLGQYLP